METKQFQQGSDKTEKPNSFVSVGKVIHEKYGSDPMKFFTVEK